MVKKILFVFGIATMFHLSSHAQSLYGIFAGPQTTSVFYKVGEHKQETQNKYGAQAGALVKIPFEHNLYFTPSVYYSVKGYEVTLTHPSYPPGEDATSNDVRIHSIDIAPLFQVDLSKTPGHFFVRFGPSVEAIFSGKEKVGLKNNTTVERPMKFSFGDYGRLTASAIGQLGYETSNGFMVFAHYGHGLGSMNNADGGPQIKHRVAGLSIGKYIGRSKH